MTFSNDSIIHSQLFYTNDTIIAKSVNFFDDIKIGHKFFVLQNQNYVEVSKYSLKTRFTFIRSINNLFEEYLLTQTGKSIDSISHLANSTITQSKINELIEASSESSDDLYLKFVAESFSGLNWYESSSSVNCLANVEGCYYREDYVCVVNNPTNPYPNGQCNYYAAGDDCIEQQRQVDPIRDSLDDDKYYTFRDTFLLDSFFGLKYINFYYALSNHFKEVSIPSSLLYDTASVLFIVHEKIDMLVNEESGVLLTESENEKLTSLLISYKSLSSNIDYLAILDEIIADLDKMEGMTIEEFLNEI